MKVALVHDFLKEYGGAERVLEALHEIWPEAPVYTSVYLPEYLGPHRERFKDWDIRISWLQYIPFKEKLISAFRVVAPFVFKQFDFSNFDVVIVSATGAYTPNTIQVKKPKTKDQRPIHVCYCHTPPRYLYGYPTAREWKKNPIIRIIGEIANHFLRLVDFKSAQNVDYFIANSKNIAARIEKFYRRDATVIYPPVDTPVTQKPSNPKTRTYFLAGGRLARPKNIQLIVQACKKLKMLLKVFGREFVGGLNIPISQYPNIQFLGEVTDEDKFELMRNAKAYIFAGEGEDFGITPVEAMAVGTPIIALRSGGVVESIVENKTGLFFNTPTVDSLVSALKQFDRVKFDPDLIAKHARRFSKERFKREMVDFVSAKIKDQNAK